MLHHSFFSGTNLAETPLQSHHSMSANEHTLTSTLRNTHFPGLQETHTSLDSKPSQSRSRLSREEEQDKIQDPLFPVITCWWTLGRVTDLRHHSTPSPVAKTPRCAHDWLIPKDLRPFNEVGANRALLTFLNDLV